MASPPLPYFLFGCVAGPLLHFRCFVLVAVCCYCLHAVVVFLLLLYGFCPVFDACWLLSVVRRLLLVVLSVVCCFLVLFFAAVLLLLVACSLLLVVVARGFVLALLVFLRCFCFTVPLISL